MTWQKVALIGVGLLGGSLGLALKRRRLARRIEGFVRRDASIGECERLGVVDSASQDLEAVVRGADLVVFCTPLAQMLPLAQRLAPVLSPGTLVTDVGSVKAPVVRDLEPLCTAIGAHFIGSHPMAGAEKTGPAAANPDLFKNSVCVVTPTPGSSREQVERLETLWQQLGMVTLRMAADVHDDLVSRSSHLPHVVASGLANYVLSPANPPEQGQLCANGFRDTTRIASSSPEMWRDICLSNRKNLVRVLGVFIADLQEFQLCLDHEDAAAIEEFFAQAKQRRDRWRSPADLSSSE